MNSHILRYWNLNPARLPIPPLPQFYSLATFFGRRSWLGYQDLNLGMPGSKPGALPLGDIPTKKYLIVLVLIKNVVRKERLELSHPKILEPKSSASTNSATPAVLFFSNILW